MSKQDVNAYIAMLERMEQNEDAEKAAIANIALLADHALLAADIPAFTALKQYLEGADGVRLLSHSADLMRLRFVIGAVEAEQAVGFAPFTSGVSSFHDLLERYMETTLMLRRIEFDLEPGAEEACSFIRNTPVSPYAVSAILYNMISILGHREAVLLKLAQDALDHGMPKEALGFLSVVENPSDDTVCLKNELEQVLRGGVV